MTEHPFQNKCYDCKHRQTIPGSCHSRCGHPRIPQASAWDNVAAVLRSVGRLEPMNWSPNPLGVRGDAYAVSQGWFNWPFDFDPVWLNHCGGFEAKEASE